MDGYDRLRELYKASTNKNKPLIEIMKYLVLQHNMSEYYLQEEKNIEQMMEFINKRAKEQAVDNVSIIEDKQVFEWALEYFKKTNEELNLNKKITTAPKTTKKEIKTDNKSNEQLTLEFDYDVY